MKSKVIWTQDEVTELYRLRETNEFTVDEIAKQLKKTVSQVQAKLKNDKRKTVSNVGEINSLVKIADKLGFTYGELLSRLENGKPLVETATPAIEKPVPEAVVLAIESMILKINEGVEDCQAQIKRYENLIVEAKTIISEKERVARELEDFLDER